MSVSAHSRPADRGRPAVPPSRADDATIVALLIAREPHAIELAYDNWAASLLTIAFRITGDADAAEARVMSAYMELWRDSAVSAVGDETLLAYLLHSVIAGGRSTT